MMKDRASSDPLDEYKIMEYLDMCAGKTVETGKMWIYNKFIEALIK
jgi:hypothetical protein